MSMPKYAQVAASVRAQIESGTLPPGAPAPSGAALARITGYSAATCRQALRTLIEDGALVPGTSRHARPRVPGPATADDQPRANAARTLSTALASRRRAANLTQPQLAAITGVSVTTIGHAETGRVWQSRQFWERADEGLGACGELLRLHDAFRAAKVSPEALAGNGARKVPDILPVSVKHIVITWSSGSVTIVYPPGHMQT